VKRASYEAPHYAVLPFMCGNLKNSCDDFHYISADNKVNSYGYCKRNHVASKRFSICLHVQWIWESVWNALSAVYFKHRVEVCWCYV